MTSAPIKPKVRLRQLIRRDIHNHIVYRGVIHAVFVDGPWKGRSACGRWGATRPRWVLADQYNVTCVPCLRRLSGKRYHNGPANQYEKGGR